MINNAKAPIKVILAISLSVLSSFASAATGNISASPTVCTITAGNHSCTSTISWTASNATYPCVFLADGTAWQCGANESRVVTWIHQNPTSFILKESYTFGSQTLGQVTVYGKPATPGGVSVPNSTNENASYQVSWGASSNGVTYTVEEQKNSGGWGNVYTGVGTGTTLSGRSSGSYRYRVKATNISASSGFAYSGYMSVTAPPSGNISASPTVCTIPAGSNTCSSTLSWLTSNVSSACVVLHTGSAWSCNANSSLTATWINHEGVTFYLKHGNNLSAPTLDQVFVYGKPATPSSITVPTTTDGIGNYTVEWAASSTGASYVLEESKNGGAWTTKYTGALPQATLNTSEGGNYQYQVKATLGTRESTYKVSPSQFISVPVALDTPIISLASTDDDGEYTVDWDDINGANSYDLSVYLDGTFVGTHTNIASSFKDETGMQDGVYGYEVRACNSGGSNCSPHSPRAFITVTNTATPLPDGIYAGDLNFDGLTDFYVKQSAGSGSDTGSFVLQQLPDNTFEIISILTGAQQSTVDQWGTVAVDIIQGDFNIDGHVDVVLKGIEGLILNGVPVLSFDQMVFASPQAGTGPTTVTAIDEDFQQFFGEVYSWIVNPNYFEENAPVVTQSVTVNDTIYIAEYCASPAWVSENGPLSNQPPVPTYIGDSLEDIQEDNQDFIFYCNSNGWTIFHYDFVSVQYQVLAGQKDFSVFNQDALILRDVFPSVFDSSISSMEHEDIEPLASKLSEVLDIPVDIGTTENQCIDAPIAANLTTVIPAICPAITAELINLLGILATAVGFEALSEDDSEAIYRAYGGVVGAEGRSWTPQFPLSVPDFRDGAGLPIENECSFIMFGKLLDDTGMVRRQALEIIGPGDYHVRGGRVLEYFFNDPSRVSPAAGQIEYGRPIFFSPPC